MRVRIGQSIEGQPVRVDSTRPGATVLLGDPGTGKTTLARYLVRWWLANTEQRVRVDAARPSEWRDLADCSRTTVRDLDASSPVSPVAPETGVGTGQLGLWVIDGLEDVGDPHGAMAGHDLITDLTTDLTANLSVIVTAATAWDAGQATARDGRRATVNVDWWGLLRPSPSGPPTGPPTGSLSSGPSGGSSSGAGWMTDPTQARLDWGAQTRPLLPDLRGPVDFPRHRWQTSPMPNAEPLTGAW